MRCNPRIPGGGIRFTRKSTHENERLLFQHYWQEMSRLWGTYVHYYVHGYQLSAHDFFYGEQPTAPFSQPRGMTLLVEMQQDSLLLSKFGIQTNADATFIIPIQTYRQIWGPGAEPKSGDLIRMTELGWDRPGGAGDLNEVTAAIPVSACEGAPNPLDAICLRGPESQLTCETDVQAYSSYDESAFFNALMRGAPVFEITERRDQIMSLHYNILMGHYVWICHAKRFDYSYEPNAPLEPGHDQVSDETLYGKLSGGTQTPEKPKQYPQNTDDEANRENWNYDRHAGSNDSVYGDF